VRHYIGLGCTKDKSLLFDKHTFAGVRKDFRTLHVTLSEAL